MPKTGATPQRRKELIDAAILAIGERGSLNVTMNEIAKKAGVSSALAHHYFGAKDELLIATMRQLVSDLIVEMSAALSETHTPRERLSTIVKVNFSVNQFRPEIISAWLAFYVEAQRSPELRRLLRIYTRRTRSNLLSGLRPLVRNDEAEQSAEAIASLIDGFYVRRALRDGLPNPAGAIGIIERFIDTTLKAAAKA